MKFHTTGTVIGAERIGLKFICVLYFIFYIFGVGREFFLHLIFFFLKCYSIHGVTFSLHEIRFHLVSSIYRTGFYFQIFELCKTETATNMISRFIANCL